MTKRQIEIVLAIERYGNITKAADFIGVSQATVSSFLLKTEAKLGVKLFYRYAKGMKATGEGAIFLKAYSNILEQMDYAHKQVAVLRGEYKDQFRLGTHPILGELILPQLEKALEKYGDIDLNYVFMNSREVTEGIATGSIDIGIVSDPQKYPELVIRTLRKEFTGLYSRDGKEKEKLLYNSQMIFSKRFIDEVNASRKKKVDDYPTLFSILKSSKTMGFLPSILANSDNKLKLIRKIGPPIDICLVYNSKHIKNKALTALTSIIRDCTKK